MEFDVAPFTGAWIETAWRSRRRRAVPSRPSRARGLKQEIQPLALRPGVAPFTGAWIET